MEVALEELVVPLALMVIGSAVELAIEVDAALVEEMSVDEAGED